MNKKNMPWFILSGFLIFFAMKKIEKDKAFWKATKPLGERQ